LLRHTILHPVLKPGSIARTFFHPKEKQEHCRKFSAKTPIASTSAFSFEIFLNSVSIEDERSLFQLSVIALAIISEDAFLPL